MVEAPAVQSSHTSSHPLPLASHHEKYIGSHRGLFILVEFSDVEFSRRDIKEVYDSICNMRGYNTYPFKGSVRDYFLEQSDGLFDLTFDIVGPIKADNDESYYGSNSGWGIDGNVPSLVKEVINKVKTTVSFQDYDWNDDGECDQVFLLYAGHGEAQGGPAWTIWPCEGKLSKQLGSNGPMEVDGITIDTFACSCELNGKEGQNIDGIGTICHEFSHCLGLPDFYNASDMDDYCMITYDVMDLGVYNGGSYCPCGYTGWERWFCGWREFVELTEPLLVDNWKSLTEGGETFIIRNDGDRKGNEYYVLDNRQFVGFDSCLYSAGMVVMHVDYDADAWATNNVNTDKKHQRFMLVAADNIMDFATSDTDAFPYTYMNGLRTLDSLTNNSRPRTTTFVKNKDGKNLLNKPVYDIRQKDDGLMSFGFMMHNIPDTPEEPTLIPRHPSQCDEISSRKNIYDLQGRPIRNTPSSFLAPRTH